MYEGLSNSIGANMDENSSLLTWVLGSVVGLLTLCGTVISYLFRLRETQQLSRISSLELLLQECERKHEESQQQILELSVRVAKLERAS